jgi:hypothetical protein
VDANAHLTGRFQPHYLLLPGARRVMRGARLSRLLFLMPSQPMINSDG